MVSLCISKIAYNKRINTRCARWGQKHVGSLRFARYYSLRIFARYAGVSCLQEIFAFGVKLEECE